MATYYIDDTQGSASGSSAGGGGNSYLRSLSQLAESQGRQRYYDYLMGAEDRKDTQFERVKETEREQFRLNLLQNVGVEDLKRRESLTQYNGLKELINANNAEMTNVSNALSNLGLQIDPAGKLDSTAVTGIIDQYGIDMADDEDFANKRSAVSGLLRDLQNIQESRQKLNASMAGVDGVVMNSVTGQILGFEYPTRLKDFYMNEFKLDPFNGQPLNRKQIPDAPDQEQVIEANKKVEEAKATLTPEEAKEADSKALGSEIMKTSTSSAPDVNPLNAARKYLWGEDMQPEFYQKDIPTDELIPTALSRLNEQRSELQNRINSLESPTFVTRSSPYSRYEYRPVTESTQIKGDSRMREDAAESKALLGELGELNSLIQSMSPATTAPSSPAPADPRTSGQTMGPEFFRQQSPQTLDQVGPIGIPAEAVQDQVGPSGMPAEALIDMDEVGPSGMPVEAFEVPSALQSVPVGITDPRYVTPIPAPPPQSDMRLMEMDGSMGPDYIPTSNTGLMDMDGNLMPEFTAPPVRSSGLMMNQDGTMGESIQPFLPYLNKNLPQEEIPFDPQGTGYNYPEALRAGNMWSSPDDKWFSRVPSTGQLLKGTGHKSWPQTVTGETEAGNVITEGPDGMMYSNPPTIGPEAFRDATPDQKARDNRKIMLESEMEGLRDLGDLWEDRVNVLENKELATSIIQYADLLTGVTGAGRALLTKFGFAGLKKLLSSKSGAELADEVAQIQANKAARALVRQRTAAPQTYTGASPAKAGPAVRGLHGRFAPAPQMEYKIIPDLVKPPPPALRP